jgi:hypothetical protein
LEDTAALLKTKSNGCAPGAGVEDSPEPCLWERSTPVLNFSLLKKKLLWFVLFFSFSSHQFQSFYQQ